MSDSDAANDVYDLFYPSPPDLRELTSIEIALDLWRREIIEHRMNNTLDDLDLESNNSQLETLSSNTPTTIFTTIEEFTKKVGSAIGDWLSFHIQKGLLKFDILNTFIDFVCDFNCDIHCLRTAKRMMLCDGISDEVKFEIACWNCMEDEILNFWPSVSSHAHLDKMDLDKSPLTCYWLCRLKNQFYRIAFPTGYRGNLDELLLDKVAPYWPSTQYFLNRLNPDTRSSKMISLLKNFTHQSNALRYLLPKLNDEELRVLLADYMWWRSLIHSTDKDRTLRILCTLSCIKNRIYEKEFVSLVRNILSDRGNRSSGRIKANRASLCEIWTSAPDHLKQSAIKYIFLSHPISPTLEDPRNVSFLLAMLSDASIEARKIFWGRNWTRLIVSENTQDLRSLANLCFSNETDFEKFRAAQMSKFESVRPHCLHLLSYGCFQDLNEYLKFCCVDEKTIKEVKLKVLSEVKPNIMSIHFTFRTELVEETNSLNQFIDDAYEPDVDLANTYKTQLLLNNDATLCLKQCMLQKGCFQSVIQFVDTFAVTQQNAEDFKRREILPFMRLFLSASFPDERGRSGLLNELYRSQRHCSKNFYKGLGTSAGDELSTFMSWLLANDDETAQFKQAIPVDYIVQNLIRREIQYVNKLRCDSMGRRVRHCSYNHFFTKFLEWYFATDEALEEFKMKYAHDDVFMKMITK